MNVGATVPEEAGKYFAWGDVQGHMAGEGYNFSVENYADSPAADISSNLIGENDMATVALGEPWRLPSATEITELNDNCSSIWATQNGQLGRLFTSNINGNILFLPAVGGYVNTENPNLNVLGVYWSNTWVDNEYARSLQISESSVNANLQSHRQYGLSVRPVKSASPSRSIVLPTPEDEPKEEETPTTEEPKDENKR